MDELTAKLRAAVRRGKVREAAAPLHSRASWIFVSVSSRASDSRLYCALHKQLLFQLSRPIESNQNSVLVNLTSLWKLQTLYQSRSQAIEKERAALEARVTELEAQAAMSGKPLRMTWSDEHMAARAYTSLEGGPNGAPVDGSCSMASQVKVRVIGVRTMM